MDRAARCMTAAPSHGGGQIEPIPKRETRHGTCQHAIRNGTQSKAGRIIGSRKTSRAMAFRTRV